MKSNSLIQILAVTLLIGALSTLSWLYYQELNEETNPSSTPLQQIAPDATPSLANVLVDEARHKAEPDKTTQENLQQNDIKKTLGNKEESSSQESSQPEAGEEEPLSEANPTTEEDNNLLTSELDHLASTKASENENVVASSHPRGVSFTSVTRQSGATSTQQTAEAKLGTSDSADSKLSLDSTSKSVANASAAKTAAKPDRFGVPSFRASVSSTHVIDPFEDTLLTSQQGLTFFIPANSLMGENGEVPGANVQIRIQELRANESGIAHKYYCLSATDSEKTLTIKPNRTLYVEVPAKASQRFALYVQPMHPDSPMVQQAPADYLIPLPLHTLNFAGFAATDSLSDSIEARIATIDNAAHESTLLATREFKRRFKQLLVLESASSEMLDIYIAHAQGDMHTPDSIVLATLKLRALTSDSPMLEKYESLLPHFEQYVALQQGAILPTTFEGVTLDNPKAPYLLTQSGVTPEQASWWLTLHKASKSISSQLSQSSVDVTTTTGFQLQHTGWVTLQADGASPTVSPTLTSAGVN